MASSSSAYLSNRLLCTFAVAGLALAACTGASAGDAGPTKIAVYDFELNDFSAGGGVIAMDERDRQYLGEATAEARRRLAQSGRYALVDTAPVGGEAPVKAHDIRNCGTCIGALTRKLGAGQGVLGTITRINRTEYTLLVQFFDAGSGEPVANYYTSLRMGANYAWPRGVTWLMKNRVLAEPGARR